MKTGIAALLLLSITTGLFAQSSITKSKIEALEAKQQKAEDLYKETLAIRKNKDIFYRDGNKIIYFYSSSIPVIKCKPLELTQITFDEGEVIKDVQIADNVRWNLSLTLSGEKEKQFSHLVIKPKVEGIETNVLVMTNERSYQLRFVSTETESINNVSFFHPDDHMNSLKAYLAEVEKEKTILKKEDKKGIIPIIDDYFENLSFNYEIEIIEGDDDLQWKPTRVYNNKHKMIIEFPENYSNYTSPILFWEEHDEEKVLNYRVHGNKYIVDSVPKKVVLLRGVGDVQEKVEVILLPEKD